MTVASTSTKSRSLGSLMGNFTNEYSSPYDYGLNVHFEDGKLLTGILVSLLYLTVSVSLDAAGYVPSMGLLVPVTLGALFLGFLMSFSRFDGFFAISHSMFVGLAFILLLMTRLVTAEEIKPILNNDIPELQARAYLILIEWVNWLQDAFSGNPNNNNFVFIFEISFLVWWLTYLGVWSVYRYGYTWRAIVPAGTVLVINTYYSPKSIIGFLVIFALLALVLLVRTNLAEHQLRWRERRIHFNPDISLDFLRNGLAFSVAVIAISWLTPNLGRNVQLREILSPVNRWWEATSDSVSELYSGIERRTRPVAAGFGPKLTLGGERNFGNNLIFQVDADTGRYWRAVTYDTYTGTEWFNTSEDVLEFDADTTVPVGTWELRQPLTQTITLQSPTGGVIFGAPDIFKASVPLVANYNTVASAPFSIADAASDLEEGQAVELTMTRTNRELEPGDSYTIVSWQTEITQNALKEAGTDYPSEEFVERYTQLPENFSERVEATALEVTAGAETAYEKAARIESFLRNIEYDDQIPAPPEGTDPIEYFLYDIQRGYCDYYATSMVTMLRSLGVPARTASGYAEGSFDTLSGTEEQIIMGEGVYFIYERDAHTWVEVYFPGYGWVEFEPTAGESELRRPEGTEADSLNFPSFADNFGNDPLDPMAAMEEELLLQEQMGEFAGAGGFTSDRIPQTPWLASLGVILLAVGGGWFFLRKSKLLGPTAFTPDLPTILFDRMHRWAERLGISFRLSATPYEQARELTQALPQGRRPIEQITESYVQQQFGPGEGLAVSASGDVNVGARGTLLPKGDVRILRNQMELPESWKHLQSLFVKAWVNQILERFNWRRKDHYSLTE